MMKVSCGSRPDENSAITQPSMSERLYHISEDAEITIFRPRPSPSHFDSLRGDVVFAITEQLLHNYLLPRDCPRITYYQSTNTTQRDRDIFFGHSAVDFIITVESKWFKVIQETILYCYELPTESFELLDENAGYYISYQSVIPLSVREIVSPIEELLTRNVELRFVPSLWKVADAVAQSSLQFSMIRMKYAIPRLFE